VTNLAHSGGTWPFATKRRLAARSDTAHTGRPTRSEPAAASLSKTRTARTAALRPLGVVAAALAITTTLLTGMASPAVAIPSTVYAAPTAQGSGTCFDATDACTLTAALTTVSLGGTIDLATGTYGTPGGTSSYTLARSVTIQAESGAAPVLNGEADGSPVLTVDSGVTAVLDGIVVTNGGSPTTVLNGGGIVDDGTLTIEDSTITGNNVARQGNVGGGIFTAINSSLSIVDSTISDNVASTQGGAINSDGALSISSSTISGNSLTSSLAFGGAGIVADAGSFAVTDSTIAGNSELAGFGGGIFIGGTKFVPNTVTDSTIFGNTSPFSDAIAVAQGGSPITLAGDILARPSGSSSVQQCQSPAAGIVDGGYNVSDDSSCGLTSSTSVQSSTAIDAYMGTLSNNGGPTQTVPLLANPTVTGVGPDPAYGAIPSTYTVPGGTAAVCATPDQRGTSRAPGPCDMGAFELALSPPGTPGAPTAVAGNASATVTVTPPTTGGTPSSYTVTASGTGGR